MTTITALPTPPSRSDPVNFAARGDTFLGALPTFATEANALAGEVNADAISAASSASFAGLSATNAASSSQIALAAANFKGLWSSLTGALSKPASVKHNNRFWLLLNNLADVTTSQPGVSADWTATDVGALIQNFSSSGTLAVGVKSVATVSGITLTVPVLSQGESVEVMNISNDTIIINWSGQTVKGKTPVNPFRVPPLRGFQITSNGVTLA
jgi:hypothetical protein